VGGGTNNSSHGLLTWNGKLVDLGSFNNPCNRVGLWNGTAWECLGTGVGLVARAGTVWNGNLVVVGDFWNVFQPCANCNGVAMWDGTQWTNIGAGFNNDVLCITVWDGDLVVAGDFTQSNGVPCNRIARWTGSVWEQIGPNNAFNNDIRAMVEFENELWIGGDFMNVAGCNSCDGLVKWSGTAWVGGDSGVDIQGGVDTTVRVLYVNPYDGKLYMGGHFTELNLDGVINTNCKGVAVYDGSVWAPLGTGVNDYVRAIHEYNGNIVVGGYFNNAGGVSANRIAKWNPTSSTWSAMGLGFNGVGIDEYVKSATVWNGIFFAGGAYTVAESGPMDYISQWYETPVSLPVATINAEQTAVCTGSCFNFTDETTYGPTSWLWSFPGGSITSSTMQDPPPICYSTPGNYIVTLQACNSIGCNTATQDITVTSSSSVTVNNSSICAGSSAVLTANPSTSGGTYLWSPGGATTSSITVSPSSTTIYTVSYTTAGCGVTNATSTVTVSSASPTVSVNSPTICSGSSTVLSATPSAGGGTYFWYPGNETTPTITVNPSSTQIYTVTYSIGSCSSIPVNSTVTVNPTPSVTVNNESICYGNTATLTGTPSTLGGSYLWSPGGETSASISVTPSITTNYSLIYTLSGCTSPAIPSTVSIISPAAITVNNANICLGGSTTLTATPSIAGGTYLWLPDGQTSQSILISPTSNTTYSVVYTLNGCPSNSVSGSVNIDLPPTISVNNSTICSGNIAILTATPSTGGGTFLWSPGGEITPTISVSPVNLTSYTVTYSLAGCPNVFSSGNVIVNETPIVSVNDVTICIGESATLTANPSLMGGIYSWSPNGQTTQDILVNPIVNSIYSVFYTLNGCPSNSITSNVTVIQNPSITVSLSQNILTADQTGATYQWLDCLNNNLPISGENSQTYLALVNGEYAVEINLNGCVDTSECYLVNTNDLIETDFISGIKLYPNPFNDLLNVVSDECLIGLKLILSDETGKTVKEITVNTSEFTVSLKDLSPGIYFGKISTIENQKIRLIKL
jgi:hypothetical protein